MSGKIDAVQLAEGPGWFAQDLCCHAGPRDAPFEERHGTVAVAAVLSGSFVYRGAQGRSLLSPGALLLGNLGSCFECGHEHGTGDRCLSFQFDADCWEEIASAVPGSHRGRFAVQSLPPAAALLPATAQLEAARNAGSDALEEAALALAGLALQHASGIATERARHAPRDERRISEAVRRIHEAAHHAGDARLSLAALAADASMSRYHFLRTFRRLVGTTPRQYVLHLRMQRAAVALRTRDLPVTRIALDAGFDDLSTFVRRFRKTMGVSPGVYQKQARR